MIRSQIGVEAKEDSTIKYHSGSNIFESPIRVWLRCMMDDIMNCWSICFTPEIFDLIEDTPPGEGGDSIN